MFTMTIPEPLPVWEGPRLHHYSASQPGLDPSREPQIDFLEFLGEGSHACVFKARIDGQLRAIKIFKFIFYGMPCIEAEHKFLRPGEMEANCMPFHMECRAFARLKEVNKEHLAVRCHGYLHISSAVEARLAVQFPKCASWDREPEDEGDLLPAIVKDFVAGPHFTPRDAPGMVRNLKQIHRCGIILNDIKVDAYVGARLVDFSLADTCPALRFDLRFGFNAIDRPDSWQDLASLDDMFEYWNECHPSGPTIWTRAFPNQVWRRRLRSWDDTKRFYEVFDYRAATYDAKQFDWRRLQDKDAQQRRRGPGRPCKQKEEKAGKTQRGTDRPRKKEGQEPGKTQRKTRSKIQSSSVQKAQPVSKRKSRKA